MDEFNNYLFKTLDGEVSSYNKIVRYLHDNKGKQVRSRLSLLCASLGGSLNERSYRAAMIVEMLHTASLLHDDIVDNSIERRGAPSVNASWGNKLALLSGDIISLKALLLSLSNKDYDIFTIYGRAVEKIAQGELLQMKKSIALNTDEKTYFEIIERKTAAFFSAACESGAISTFTNQSQIDQLRLLGEYIGIAFQIKDDLFGYFSGNTGKPNDNDFKEKKLTLPLIYTLNKTGRRNKRRIKRTFRNKNISKSDIDFIIAEVKMNGGVDYANLKMMEYGKRTMAILSQFPESESKTEIKKLVRFVTERNY